MEGLVRESGEDVFMVVERSSLMFPPTNRPTKIPRVARDLNNLVRLELNRDDNSFQAVFNDNSILKALAPSVKDREAWVRAIGSFQTKTRPMAVSKEMTEMLCLCLDFIATQPGTEGIFRQPAASTDLRKLWKQIVVEGNNELPDLLVGTIDMVAIADMVKLALRRLPESVLTAGLYKQFVSAAEAKDPNAVYQLVQQLPITNREVLSRLARVCALVVREPASRMDWMSLSTVLAPALLPSMEQLATVGIALAPLFEIFVNSFPIVFPELTQAAKDAGVPMPTTPAPMPAQRPPRGQPVRLGSPNAGSPSASANSPYPQSPSVSTPAGFPNSPAPGLMSPLPQGEEKRPPPLRVGSSTELSSMPPPPSTHLGVATPAPIPAAKGVVFAPPVEVDKNMNLMMQGAQIMILKHYKNSLKQASVAATMKTLAQRETYSRSLKMAMQMLSEALRESENHRKEAMAHLNSSVLGVVDNYHTRIKGYDQTASRRDAAAKRLAKFREELNIAKAREQKSSKVDQLEEKVSAESVRVAHAETDLFTFERNRIGDMKRFLKTFVDSQLYVYAREIEQLGQAYAAVQMINRSEDETRMLNELRKRENYGATASAAAAAAGGREEKKQ